MAWNLNLVEALQAIQLEQSENVGINDPSNYQKMTGFIDYLFSDVNPRTINTTMGATADNGKIRPVEIRYTPKKSDEEVMTAEGDYSCDKGVTRREKIDNVQPTQFAGDKFTIDEAIIREGTLETVQQRLSKEIRDSMRNTREQIDLQQYTIATNNIGANPAQNASAGTYTTLEMLNADGTLKADTFDVIKNDQEDNFMGGEAAIIGLGNARKSFNRLAVGNVNDGGVDFSEVRNQFGMLLYKDQFTTQIQGSSGANRVVVAYPGLAQFFHYNYYRNSDIANTTPDLSIKTTIQDSVYPITYDFHLKYDDGCSTGNPQGYWVGQIFLYHDLWIAPEDMFGNQGYSNNLQDFNGLVGYDITQASS